MSAFKGTPGPRGVYRDANGRISKIEGGTGRVCTLQPSDRNGDANARLIAAAPELLSSLEFAVKLLSGLPHVGGTAQLEHMRSVIAKATGGAA